MQEVQKEQAAKDGKPYYDNDLVVAKPDGAPIAASWVSSQFGKLLEDLKDSQKSQLAAHSFSRFTTYGSDQYAPTDRRLLYGWRSLGAYACGYRRVAWAFHEL